LEPQRFDTLLPAARAASGQQALLGRFTDSALGSARNASDSLEQDFLTVLFYFRYNCRKSPEINGGRTRTRHFTHRLTRNCFHNVINDIAKKLRQFALFGIIWL
jgi:hypothetical protein